MEWEEARSNEAGRRAGARLHLAKDEGVEDDCVPDALRCVIVKALEVQEVDTVVIQHQQHRHLVDRLHGAAETAQRAG